LKSVVPSQETAEAHYEVHKERPFYPGLIKFVTSGPVVCMAWSGKDAIAVARTLIGSTNGREATPGTIRGDFGMDMGFNMIHGSDAPETAAFELGLWFPEGLMEWDQTITTWVYE
jgi:nucleoside-diphosphate kinase